MLSGGGGGRLTLWSGPGFWTGGGAGAGLLGTACLGIAYSWPHAVQFTVGLEPSAVKRVLHLGQRKLGTAASPRESSSSPALLLRPLAPASGDRGWGEGGSTAPARDPPPPHPLPQLPGDRQAT